MKETILLQLTPAQFRMLSTALTYTMTSVVDRAPIEVRQLNMVELASFFKVAADKDTQDLLDLVESIIKIGDSVMGVDKLA